MKEAEHHVPTPVMVFSRTPVAGQTKRRLIPALGPEQACRIHELMLRRVLATAVCANIGPVTLWCTPTTKHQTLQALSVEFDIELATQRGGDLGERMANAFEASLPASGGAVCVGCDCPGLTPNDLQQTAALVGEQNLPVLGPALDGGYYLIGLPTMITALFDNVLWGSDTVLTETRAQLRGLGLNWRELQHRRDVDRPEDLTILTQLGLYQPPS